MLNQTMIAHHGAVQSTEDIYSEGRVPMDTEKSFAAQAIVSGATCPPAEHDGHRPVPRGRAECS